MSDGPFPSSTALSRRTLTLPRLLFWLNLLVASALVGLVCLSPLLDAEDLGSYSKLVALFAHDAAVRQTAVASAIALGVTAWVFFRPSLRERGSMQTPRLPPPTNVIGA